MMKEVETRGAKLLNVFPLRTDNIPKNVSLDTTAIVNFFGVSQWESEPKSYFLKNIHINKDKIWRWYLNLDKKVFRKRGYVFSGFMETDGVSCSIVFQDTESYNRKTQNLLSRKRKRHQMEFESSEGKVKEEHQEIKEEVKDQVLKKYSYSKEEDQYFDQVQIDPTKKFVAIDPNKRDLLFCISHKEFKDDDDDNRFPKRKLEYFTKLRFTQNEIRKKTKATKYRRIIQDKRRSSGVKEIEQELSEYNHKTLDFDKYKDYLGKKIEIASKVASEYQDQLYRKLRWNTYMNRQRVEDQFMNKFKELWPPDKFIVGIGDYGPSHHMKHLEPVKGKGFRKMFRRKGYEIYLVDEYRTSIRCYNCGCGGQIGRCEKFKRV